MTAERAIACMERGEWRQALAFWSQVPERQALSAEQMHAYARTCEVLGAWDEHEAVLTHACQVHPQVPEFQARGRYRQALIDLQAQRWQEAATALDVLAREMVKNMPWPPSLRYYRREADIGILLQGVGEPERVLQLLGRRQLFKYPRPYPAEQLAGIERVVEALPGEGELKAQLLEHLGELIFFAKSRDDEPLLIRDEHFTGLVDRLAVFLRNQPQAVDGLPAPYCAYFCRLLLMFGHFDLYFRFRQAFCAALPQLPAPEKLADYIYSLTLANEQGDEGEYRRLKDLVAPLLTMPGSELLNLSTLYHGPYQGEAPDGQNDQAFAQYLAGKSVAVVGPVQVGLESGEEIDGFDVVVRLNHQHAFAYEPRYFGSRTNCSYYLSITENPALQSTLIDLDYVMFEEGENCLPAAVVARRRMKTSSYLVSPFLFDMPNSIQQVLMDLLRFSPARIKVFNSNLYLSLDYASGYFSGGLVLWRPMAVHDPVSNFLFMQRLFSQRLIEVDAVLGQVLGMSVSDYVAALNATYGKEREAVVALLPSDQ